jgi:hypothetical protein
VVRTPTESSGQRGREKPCCSSQLTVAMSPATSRRPAHKPGWLISKTSHVVPTDVRPRVHALVINENAPGAPLSRVLAIAPQFNVKGGAGARDRPRGRRRWPRFASDCGLTQRQLDRMATVFEHDDADVARAL